MKKVGIVSDLARRNVFSGMGVYISEISKALAKTSSIKIVPIYLNPGTPPFEPVVVQLKMLLLTIKQQLDVVYFPNPPIPIINIVPAVLTIPDLSFIYDSGISIFVKWYLWVTYFISAHSARVITTFSQNSLKDINKYLLVPLKKISIISPAVIPEFKNSLQKKKPIILSVPGTFIPRKNVKDLLWAYSRLSAPLREKYKLVVIGRKDTHYFPEIEKFVQQLNLHNSVEFVGNPSTPELVNLNQTSTISVYPSLYEGFGLPPLEAMACGLPVIAYKNSSLMEIVGEAGLLVSSKEELLKGMTTLLLNKSCREQMIAKGLVQAKKYSWTESAQNLLKLFDYVDIHL